MRRKTARMLILFVKADRPKWTAKKCAQWLTTRMPELKKAVRKGAQDWIREDLLAESLATEGEL